MSFQETCLNVIHSYASKTFVTPTIKTTLRPGVRRLSKSAITSALNEALPYLFKVMLMTLKYFDAALLRGKGADIPDPECVVHGVREDVGAVGGQRESGNRVVVATHAVQSAVLAQVPHLQTGQDGGNKKHHTRATVHEYNNLYIQLNTWKRIE